MMKFVERISGFKQQVAIDAENNYVKSRLSMNFAQTTRNAEALKLLDELVALKEELNATSRFKLERRRELRGMMNGLVENISVFEEKHWQMFPGAKMAIETHARKDFRAV